jgi:hypothetical protein
MNVRRLLSHVLVVLLLASFLPLLADHGALATSGDLIDRVYTDKARHEPGDPVTITVEIDNQTGSAWSGIRHSARSLRGELTRVETG